MARRKQITALFTKVRHADRRLYDWMRAHHDELLVELGSGRIVWRPVMRVIADLGLVDDRGQKPTRDTAFRTWKRVRGDVATARTERQDKPALNAVGEIAPGVRALLDQHDQAVVEPMVTTPRIRLDIRPARPIGSSLGSKFQTPEGPATATGTSSVTAATPVEDADAQIRRVFDAIGSARTPMPKIIP
jgi:hypothetical protein